MWLVATCQRAPWCKLAHFCSDLLKALKQLTNVQFTLQQVDIIISARSRVLKAFSMKEDRLGAIKILCDFWHNPRKKHNEIHKEGQVALALAGKQNQTSEIIHCVVLYTSTSMDFLLQWTVAINFACNEQY